MVESDQRAAAFDGFSFAFTYREMCLLTSCKPLADISRICWVIVCSQQDWKIPEDISEQSHLKDWSVTRVAGRFH